MNSLLLIAQVVKIVAGLAQLAFALWLVSAGARSLLSVSFAAFFGLNGIAYTLFNLTPATQRSTVSFAFQGRLIVNWFAAAAMLVFIFALVAWFKKISAFALGALVAVAVLIADLLSLRAHSLGLSALGGIATYPLTAFVLGYLAVAFSSADAMAALAINSVDHLGAELIAPSPTPAAGVVLQITAMALIVLVWLFHMVSNGSPRRSSSLVVLCFVAPFLAGLCIRVATGSYRGFQQSGAVGAGRLAAVALLAYGLLGGRDSGFLNVPARQE